MPKKTPPRSSTSGKIPLMLPKDIVFEAPPRTRVDGLECRITNTERKGKRYSRLTLARWVLKEAGIKEGQRVALRRGKAPHHRWVRVEPASYGQTVPEKGNVAVSVKHILKSSLKLEGETVQPMLGKEAIYFELPEHWLSNS
jgi:hypothetical protein